MRQLIADGMHVQMCVTSPPYWGLRDYGTAQVKWADGWIGSYGLEPTPQMYIDHTIEVFAIMRDLLADDGTLWLNLGDTYAQLGGPGWQGKDGQRADRRFTLVRDSVPLREASRCPGDLKPKDLVMIPARVALALQADGWYLRQDIIWHKPNPMPESVTDRCTKAHEYLFLLSKSERYYWDFDAMQEPVNGNAHARGNGLNPKARMNATRSRQNESMSAAINGLVESRNRRSVWTIPSAPYAEAHFATFPPALIEPCILAGSRVGDVVLDPFFGSGTTGHVAQKLGRKWIGCDLQPAYASMQDRRTAQQGMEL